MSFFSKKTSGNQSSAANNGLIIKTMQDDLNATDGLVYQQEPTEKQAPPQISLNEESQNAPENTPQASPVSQSPFAAQDQIRGAEQELFITRNEVAPSKQASGPKILITSHPLSKSVVSLIVLIIFVSIGGIYYFILTRNAPAEPVAQTNLNTTLNNSTTPDTKPVQDTTTPQKDPVLFSADKPNYLPIDILNSTPTSIQATLSQTAQQVTSLASAKPVEFIITDKNNTPISFAAFVKASGITLSQATLTSLGEKFSLYVYTSDQTSHIGLSIELKNRLTLQSAFKREEAALIQALSPLFLSDTPTKLTGAFSNSAYLKMPIRYINIHPETSLSIDYAVLNRYLVIGTSMKTEHALLDVFQGK
jgi:hypothetical protein